jgi:hypothetical protein
MRWSWRISRGGASLGLVLASTLFSTATYACSVCGGGEDNGYFWGMLFLMSMPFTVTTLVGGWLLYTYHRPHAGPVTTRPRPASEPHSTRPALMSSAIDGHHAEP